MSFGNKHFRFQHVRLHQKTLVTSFYQEMLLGFSAKDFMQIPTSLNRKSFSIPENKAAVNNSGNHKKSK